MPMPKTYLGVPLLPATPEMIRTAVMLGRQIIETVDYAAYECGDKIVFVNRRPDGEGEEGATC